MPPTPLDLLAPNMIQPAKANGSDVEKLMAAFAAHEVRERDALSDYHENAKSHENPLVRFLLQLIISDEEKHHDIIRRLLTSLEADLEWNSRAKNIPALGKLKEEDRRDLLKLTDSLIAEEKQGIADYKALLKSTKGYYNGLLELMVETVIHDSKKHLMILRFLKQRLRKTA